MKPWLTWRSIDATVKFALLSGLVLVAINVIIYRPALESGFWSDDYHMIAPAARLSWQGFLTYYLDPRVQWIWYRPVQGLAIGLEYSIFKGDAHGYHLIQLLLHTVNTLLLGGLVAHLSRRWRLGLVAALLYETWSLTSLPVYWPAVPDPLMALLCLLTLWLWIRHLETGGRALACGAFITWFLALGAKENAVVMPVVLVLTELWLLARPIQWPRLLKRYAPFLVLLVAYGVLEVYIARLSAFTRQSGYGVGSQVLANVYAYARWLVFPWSSESVWPSLFLVLAGGLIVVLLVKRRLEFLFLPVAALLILAPVTLFQGVETRYLYFPLMISAIAWAFVAEGAHQALSRFTRQPKAAIVLVALALAGLVGSGSAAIADGAESYRGFVQQINLKLRPIFRQHAAFESDTLLYFVDPPYPMINLSGAIALRYGANVSVGSLEIVPPAELRQHRQAFVYYADEHGDLQEQQVAHNNVVTVTPRLPVCLEEGICLVAFQVAKSELSQGETLLLFLQWSASERIKTDYTIFTHLVDRDGQTVAAYDGQPGHGNPPTSGWQPKATYWDLVTLPMEAQTPGDYQLELGLYDAATMRRLSVLGEEGQAVPDPIILGPIHLNR